VKKPKPRELTKAEMRALGEAAVRACPITHIPRGVSGLISNRQWRDIVQTPGRVDLEAQALQAELAKLQEEAAAIERAISKQKHRSR
jgi:hypothetical protein